MTSLDSGYLSKTVRSYVSSVNRSLLPLSVEVAFYKRTDYRLECATMELLSI